MSPAAARTGSPAAADGAPSSASIATAVARLRRVALGRGFPFGGLGWCAIRGVLVWRLLSRGRGAIGVQRPGEDGLRGTEQHRHVPALGDRPLLDDGELCELLREPLEDRLAPLGVRDLAPAEHDRDLDLVLVLEETLDVRLLGGVVVLGDLRPELDLA